MPKTLEIRTNDFSGRSYYSTCALPTNETVLDIDTPYSCTIYKQFRTEVCAECFDYQSGRRGFLTCREYSENAGLSFCDPDCRDVWIRREGVDLIGYLAKLETRRLKKKSKEAGCLRVVVTDEEIEEAWRRVEEEEHGSKQARKWGQLLLDDFEADIARYVLMALYHQSLETRPSQELCHLTSNGDEPSTLAPDGVLLEFGYANWDSFSALQSNETTQINLFPELLDNHIRIYQVLKALFSQSSRQAPHGNRNDIKNGPQNEILRRLECTITTMNVRRALGVDPGNSFGVWESPLTDESECLGFAVYPTPSFFNHHCLPNVRKERSGRRLRFLTTRPVDSQEELCISYGHVENMVVKERQKTLLDGWYFKCMCSRCLLDRYNS